MSKDNKSELRLITNINSRKKGISERKKQVEEILNENYELIVDYGRKSALCETGDSRYSEYIEQMGTYLIDSSDTESCRQLEYSFYQNDRRYGQYAIGEATFPIDFTSSNNVLNENYIEDEYEIGVEDMSVSTSSMNDTQLRKLARIGIPEKDVESSRLKEFMLELYQYTKDGLGHVDLEIFELMIKGKTDKEISELVDMPRRTVTYRVGKIVGIMKGFS